jgi:hypothetical protein
MIPNMTDKSIEIPIVVLLAEVAGFQAMLLDNVSHHLLLGRRADLTKPVVMLLTNMFQSSGCINEGLPTKLAYVVNLSLVILEAVGRQYHTTSFAN